MKQLDFNYFLRRFNFRTISKDEQYFKTSDFFLIRNKTKSKIGLIRDLNPGPPAPKAGIIPLDH